MVQANVINSAYQFSQKRMPFLGSSCIYPRDGLQLNMEKYMLSGPLQPTNDSYAIVKIAGIKLSESYNRQYGTHYVSMMPANLFGAYDNCQGLRRLSDEGSCVVHG